ncbi:MAG: hypothetical protein QM751_06230 [Paludibacteraceae bacterium]
MKKIIDTLNRYWYVVAVVLGLVGYYLYKRKKNDLWDIVEYAKKLFGMVNSDSLYKGYNLELISFANKVPDNKYAFLKRLLIFVLISIFLPIG